MPATLYIDLDGTILDVWPRYYSVFRSFWSNKLTAPFPDLAEYRQLKMTFVEDTDVVRHLAERSQVVLDAVAIWREYRLYKQTMLESEEMLGLDTIIGRLDDFAVQLKSDYKLHLLSIRKHHSFALEQLDRLGIRKWFEQIEFLLPSRGDNPKWGAIKNRASSNDIIVGDSETDIACGSMLGLRSFHVSTGLRSYAYVSRYGPATALTTYSDLCLHL